jgi:predicted DNA-binding transcriptional regulator YafY
MAGTADRLLRLLALLQQRTSWRGPELADRLRVTERTVRRDIGKLRDLGYRIDSAPGVDGGYELGVGPSMPPLLLDDDEATAIAIALGVSAGGGVPGIEEPALAALAKIERVLPTRLRGRVHAVRSATTSIATGDDVGPAILVALAQAATDRERVRITYVDREARATDRRLDPFRLVSTGRRWYLVAWDVDRQAWRTFRADRIGEVHRTGHRFELVDPPDAADLVSRASGVAPYRFTARVVVHAPVEQVRARVPSTVGVVEPHPDGALLTVGADELPSLAGHLVALGVPVEALEPAELRTHLRDVGARLTAAHRPPGRRVR